MHGSTRPSGRNGSEALALALGLAIGTCAAGCDNSLQSAIEGAAAAAPRISVRCETTGAPVPNGVPCSAGTAYQGNYRLLRFSIDNTGTANLALNGASRVELVTDGSFSFDGPMPDSPIAPGDPPQGFSVKFLAGAADTGNREATVTIRSNDPDQGIFSFAVTGEILANPTPGAPTNVAVTRGTDSGAAGVSWDGVSGALFYYIFRSETTTPPATDGERIATSSLEHYEDVLAVPGTKYYYWAKAYTSSLGLGPLSITAWGYRSLSTPNLQPGSGASDGSSTADATVTWTPVDGAGLQYHLYRNTSASLAGAQEFSTAAADYTDATAVPGRLYLYCVRAYAPSSDSWSGYSGWDSGYRKLSPPSGLTATDGASTANVAVAWSPPAGSDLSSYEIFYNTTGHPTNGATYSQASTAWTHSDAMPGVLGYYKVRSYSASSASYSDFTAFETGYRKLPAPEQLAFRAGTPFQDCGMEWTLQVPGLPYGMNCYYDKFRVYRSTSAGGVYGDVSGLIAKDFFYDDFWYDSGAAPGATYYYKVQGYATSSNSYSDQSAYAVGYGLMPAPSTIYAQNTDGYIWVNWAAVSGATQYVVLRFLADGTGYHEIATVSSGTSYWENQPAGDRAAPISYRIQARNPGPPAVYGRASSQYNVWRYP